MVNEKIKMFYDSYQTSLEDEVNQFLCTIDIRQIIKISYNSTDQEYSCMILYVESDDLRDIKIDNVLTR